MSRPASLSAFSMSMEIGFEAIVTYFSSCTSKYETTTGGNSLMPASNGRKLHVNCRWSPLVCSVDS